VSVLVDLGALPAATTAVPTVLAQNPQPPPGRGEEFGKSSPIALVVILLLGLATLLLIRSMTKRIKRLPESFEPTSAAEPDADGRDTGDAGGTRS